MKKIFFFILISFLSFGVRGQTLTYTFLDPCTNQITYFSVPATGTTIIFLNQSAVFTSDDVSNGTFGNWVNSVYNNYRNTNPCPLNPIEANQTVLQNNQVIQNQITIQIISNTVQSIVGNILSSMQQSISFDGSAMDNSVGVDGSSDAANKGNSETDKKNKNDNKSINSNNNNNTNTPATSNNGGDNITSNQNNQGVSNNNNSNSTNQNSGGNNNVVSNNSPSNNSNTTNSNSSDNNQNQTNNQQNTENKITTSSGINNTEQPTNTGVTSVENQPQDNSQGGEVATTTTMTIDATENRGSDNSSSENSGSGGNSKSSNKSNQSARSNPIIVSSDLTSAQNLNKSFTGIFNVGMSKSSLLGKTSRGLSSMTWFNLKQFALSAKYTKTHKNKKGTLKWVNNLNLTSVYSYGNILGFFGYSSILNAKKYGIAGFNVSVAATLVTKEKSSFFSPSITAFYTKPFKGNKKLTISPEIYIISTPLIYSTKDKVTQTDRYFSGFVGSGFDYQITKRFKLNVNYKANMSTNPEFPILSFFLIGSKINL